jgi:hypothetical protein
MNLDALCPALATELGYGWITRSGLGYTTRFCVILSARGQRVAQGVVGRRAQLTDVAPGAGFQVSPATLRQAAEQAHQISAAIGKSEPKVSSACLPAASAHSGWHFGRALTAAVPGWEGRLRQQSSAVSAAGGKLTTAASSYEAIDKSVRSIVDAIAHAIS